MEFYIPTETGELLAFFAAAAIGLFGLFALFAPGTALKLAGLEVKEGRSEGLAFARSAGGFYAGLAIVALMMAQSWIYMAIGGGFVLAAFGRILSLMSDGSFNLKSLLVLIIQMVRTGLPLRSTFGRILLMMSDGSFSLKNLLVLIVQLVLAGLLLGYAFGFL